MIQSKSIEYFSFPSVKIRFSSEELITAVATQGWKDANNMQPDCWVKEYFLEYSENGTTLKIHKDGSSRRVGILSVRTY